MTYERHLSTLGRFVERAKSRIWRCEWQAKLAQAKALVEASKTKRVRKGRSRRRRDAGRPPASASSKTRRDSL